MADFEAPAGPPPPKVPEGWVARWNDQYKEWFYVNTYTKKSQWEKPTEPARPLEKDAAPSGPPPSYTPGDSKTPAPTDTKVKPAETDAAKTAGASSSYYAAGQQQNPAEDEDARLARQLQAEEDARTRGSASQGPFPAQLPPRPDSSGDSTKSKGLLGKIFGGGKKPSSGGGGMPGPMGGMMGGPGQGQGQPGYGYDQSQPPAQYGGAAYGTPPPPPGGAYGGYPPPAQQGGYYPPQQQQPYGGYYGGPAGYPQQQQQQPAKKGGAGGKMGMMAGGAALGVGAGLLGGALLGSAMTHHHDSHQGYDDDYDDY